MHRRLLARLKVCVASGVCLLALALTPGALAHWTSAAEGAGRPDADTQASGFTVEGGAEPTGLYPGGTRQATVTIKNDEPFGKRLRKLTAETKKVESAATTEAEAGAGSKCWSGWFEITEVGGHPGASYELADTLPAGSSVELEVTVAMREVARNQDGCRGKKVALTYTVE